MPTYRVHFSAVVCDYVEIESDDEDFDPTEDDVREVWDSLPFVNGYTTDWDGITIDLVEEDF
jgi:hypothetical protein